MMKLKTMRAIVSSLMALALFSPVCTSGNVPFPHNGATQSPTPTVLQRGQWSVLRIRGGSSFGGLTDEADEAAAVRVPSHVPPLLFPCPVEMPPWHASCSCQPVCKRTFAKDPVAAILMLDILRWCRCRMTTPAVVSRLVKHSARTRRARVQSPPLKHL